MEEALCRKPPPLWKSCLVLTDICSLSWYHGNANTNLLLVGREEKTVPRHHTADERVVGQTKADHVQIIA